MYAAGARTFFPWGDGPWGRSLRLEPWTCRFTDTLAKDANGDSSVTG
jgi:hypothetical protein